MRSITFRFSFSMIIYRDAVFNAFLKEYKNLFVYWQMPIAGWVASFNEGMGFIERYEYADRPHLSIICRDDLQINAVMDTFYPCPDNSGCVSLPVSVFLGNTTATMK